MATARINEDHIRRQLNPNQIERFNDLGLSLEDAVAYLTRQLTPEREQAARQLKNSTNEAIDLFIDSQLRSAENTGAVPSGDARTAAMQGRRELQRRAAAGRRGRGLPQSSEYAISQLQGEIDSLSAELDRTGDPEIANEIRRLEGMQREISDYERYGQFADDEVTDLKERGKTIRALPQEAIDRGEDADIIGQDQTSLQRRVAEDKESFERRDRPEPLPQFGTPQRPDISTPEGIRQYKEYIFRQRGYRPFDDAIVRMLEEGNIDPIGNEVLNKQAVPYREVEQQGSFRDELDGTLGKEVRAKKAIAQRVRDLGPQSLEIIRDPRNVTFRGYDNYQTAPIGTVGDRYGYEPGAGRVGIYADRANPDQTYREWLLGLQPGASTPDGEIRNAADIRRVIRAVEAGDINLDDRIVKDRAAQFDSPSFYYDRAIGGVDHREESVEDLLGRIRGGLLRGGLEQDRRIGIEAVKRAAERRFADGDRIDAEFYDDIVRERLRRIGTPLEMNPSRDARTSEAIRNDINLSRAAADDAAYGSVLFGGRELSPYWRSEENTPGGPRDIAYGGYGPVRPDDMRLVRYGKDSLLPGQTRLNDYQQGVERGYQEALNVASGGTMRGPFRQSVGDDIGLELAIRRGKQPRTGYYRGWDEFSPPSSDMSRMMSGYPGPTKVDDRFTFLAPDHQSYYRDPETGQRIGTGIVEGLNVPARPADVSLQDYYSPVGIDLTSEEFGRLSPAEQEIIIQERTAQPTEGWRTMRKGEFTPQIGGLRKASQIYLPSEQLPTPPLRPSMAREAVRVSDYDDRRDYYGRPDITSYVDANSIVVDPETNIAVGNAVDFGYRERPLPTVLQSGPRPEFFDSQQQTIDWITRNQGSDFGDNISFAAKDVSDVLFNKQTGEETASAPISGETRTQFMSVADYKKSTDELSAALVKKKIIPEGAKVRGAQDLDTAIRTYIAKEPYRRVRGKLMYETDEEGNQRKIPNTIDGVMSSLGYTPNSTKAINLANSLYTFDMSQRQGVNTEMKDRYRLGLMTNQMGYDYDAERRSQGLVDATIEGMGDRFDTSFVETPRIMTQSGISVGELGSRDVTLQSNAKILRGNPDPIDREERGVLRERIRLAHPDKNESQREAILNTMISDRANTISSNVLFRRIDPEKRIRDQAYQRRQAEFEIARRSGNPVDQLALDQIKADEAYELAELRELGPGVVSQARQGVIGTPSGERAPVLTNRYEGDKEKIAAGIASAKLGDEVIGNMQSTREGAETIENQIREAMAIGGIDRNEAFMKVRNSTGKAAFKTLSVAEQSRRTALELDGMAAREATMVSQAQGLAAQQPIDTEIARRASVPRVGFFNDGEQFRRSIEMDNTPGVPSSIAGVGAKASDPYLYDDLLIRQRDIPGASKAINAELQNIRIGGGLDDSTSADARAIGARALLARQAASGYEAPVSQAGVGFNEASQYGPPGSVYDRYTPRSTGLTGGRPTAISTQPAYSPLRADTWTDTNAFDTQQGIQTPSRATGNELLDIINLPPGAARDEALIAAGIDTDIRNQLADQLVRVGWDKPGTPVAGYRDTPEYATTRTQERAAIDPPLPADSGITGEVSKRKKARDKAELDKFVATLPKPAKSQSFGDVWSDDVPAWDDMVSREMHPSQGGLTRRNWPSTTGSPLHTMPDPWDAPSTGVAGSRAASDGVSQITTSQANMGSNNAADRVDTLFTPQEYGPATKDLEFRRSVGDAIRKQNARRRMGIGAALAGLGVAGTAGIIHSERQRREEEEERALAGMIR